MNIKQIIATPATGTENTTVYALTDSGRVFYVECDDDGNFDDEPTEIEAFGKLRDAK